MKIVFLGAGNLATNLAHTLYQHGHSIIQVYSRTMDSASQLAENVHAQPIVTIQQLNKQAELYILALKDDALREVIAHNSLPCGSSFSPRSFHFLSKVR